MTDRSDNRASRSQASPERRTRRVLFGSWVILYSALIGWTLWRLDMFPLSDTVPSGVDLPRSLYTVDHPFHTARADLIRSAWGSLDTARWVSSHQGGYPAEFFPFGLPAVAAMLSLVSLGALAIESAWALAISIIFLLPALAFWLLGRRDGRTPGTALIALAGQVAIASDWTHGGFTELVEWGLATNVAGATYALLAIPLMFAAIKQRSPRWAGASAGVIALCAVSNPRSLVAVVVIAVAFIIHAALQRRLGAPALIIAGIGAIALGLSAPVVAPLLRYEELYYFLSYQEYTTLSDYRDATVDAVTWPVLALAAVGAALAFLGQKRPGTQVAAIALGVYMALSALAVQLDAMRDLIPQLELPRLMPFQRLLIIWLAACGAMDVVHRAASLSRIARGYVDVGVAAGTSIVVILVFATSLGPFSSLEQGLRDVPRAEGADAMELVSFRDAVDLADARAGEGSAILVVGSRLSWHEQLWAPMEGPDRRFFYNDWLWYWHTRHAGPYDYRTGHHYPNPSEALDREYLDTHGIGAVVITDVADQSTGASARQAAAASPGLERVETIGAWDVYIVTDATGLATLDGRDLDAAEVSEDGEVIRLSLADAESGTITIRQNWFPRWEATVNGASTPVERAANGYIAIPVRGGDLEIELRYAVTAADVIARAAAIASALCVLVLVAASKPIRQWVRR